MFDYCYYLLLLLLMSSPRGKKTFQNEHIAVNVKVVDGVVGAKTVKLHCKNREISHQL